MAKMSSRPIAEPPLLRIEPFQGMDLSVTPTQIDIHRSPEMVNVLLDEKGALNKRTGYERVFDSLGEGQINGMYLFKKADGTSVFLFCHSTNLYSLVDKVPTLIYNGLSDTKVHFFTMADICYLMDGTHFLSFDGTTVKEIEPYIPTLTISNLPTGGGTLNEDFNLLGSGFKETFTGDGMATAFQLSLVELDSTTVTISVDNVAMVEGTDFTVDRTLGQVIFALAPSKGTNNVEITAYKTFDGFADRIKKSRFSVIFGGANDTRVFISGNPDYPHIMRASGLYDPTYWPENRFYPLGNDNEAIQGFSKQYDYLVVHKENSYYNMQFTLDSNGLSSFPTKPINDQVGTYAKGSIQIIDNNPVALDRTGVYMVVASTVRDERNVQHISSFVDRKLLIEPNLEQAISIDHDRKYWLAVNGNVYIYDYSIKEWYMFDNIHANCFLAVDGEFYFGGDTIYRFRKESEVKPYNDDGQLIHALWKSKHFTFNADNRKKMVEKIFYALKPMTRASLDVYYKNNKKSSELVKTTRVDLINLQDVDFNYFSFLFTTFPQEKMVKIKSKKITHFQLILENNRNNEGLGIISLAIKYRYQSEIK